ncbi:MAG: polyprenyl synthetase family protein [Alphaproteobacteria bacterium]|nr:polyprenyl synthetase family protein [Alphaproteobacteria bacterium]
MAVQAEVQPATASEATPIDRLAALLQPELRQVEELLATRAASPVATIPDLSGYLIAAGGKRIRPILTLASARAVGGKGGASACYLAAAVEFIHTATLLHDDVIDDSDLRRGKAAAKNIWGASASILVGDFLFARAFTLMVETRDMRVLDILSRASCIIAEGEVRQLASLGRPDLPVADYMAIVEAKTAALFEAAARAGALTGCNDDSLADSMGEYGRRLGRAFQIIDDLLDYGGLTSVIGKSVGDDFREGKLTLPVILARDFGDRADRIFWDRVMGARDQGESDLSHAIHLIRSSGAAERTLETARMEAAAAQAALAQAARGSFSDELAGLADYCVNRAY